MTCNRCNKIYSIPSCLASLSLGTISQLSATVTVVFHNQTTGRKIFVDATTDPAGLVTVDMEDVLITPYQSYDIYVVDSPSEPEERIDMTLDTEVIDCVMAEFEDLKDGDGDAIIVVSHQVKLQA